jgi:hypothetical protein
MTNIAFCTSPLLRPHGHIDWDIFHGFTHRTGGTSEGSFRSLNLGLHVGDDQATVRENRARLMREFEGKVDWMVCAEQVHGARVAVVTEKDLGRGATDYATALPQTDSIVTNMAEIFLTLFFADCLPVFFADKRKTFSPLGFYESPNAVGIAHAGWRGLNGGVLENTVVTMREAFGTRSENLVAYVGPGIGPCCFEVGPEVAACFPEDAHAVNGKPHVNLPQAARRRLERAGIPASRIDVSGLCTACHPDRFFSHRRDHGKTGRMAGFIGLTI